MVPFSGPGKYKLANGQIVNLDKSRFCKESDKVSSRCGMIGRWMWSQDGSIGGGNLDNASLHLIEKLPDVKYYKHKKGFDGSLLVKRYSADKYCTIDLTGKERDGDHAWTLTNDAFVKDASWIEVSEEEAEKMRDVARGATSQDNYPKYYVGECWGASDAYVQYDSPLSYFWVNRYGAVGPPSTENRPLTKERLDVLRWKEVTKEEALKRVISSDVNSVTSVPDVSSSKKEEGNTVKKETAINVATGVAKFVGKWGWRAVNYWAFEPVTEVATKVMRAVRYVTLTGAIVGGVYAYNNPEKAADLIKSCLPKITIESPEILKS